jgi:transcriptional regulator GlxA family with amidase domain
MAPIQFGVLMVEYQTLDAVGPLDILSSCSKRLISGYEEAGLPGFDGVTAKAIDIDFHHIGETLQPLELTAGVKVVPSVTCDTCPPLDFLLIGGPDPLTFKISPRFTEFVQKHVAAGKGLFTTCTGAIVAAQAGVLEGKTATINHGALEMMPKMAPNVKWVKKQWVVDGNIWTSGGALAGMDMFAHWVIENYGLELAKLGLEALDFEPRDINGGLVLPRQHGVESA